MWIIFIIHLATYDFLNIPNGARYSIISSNIGIKVDPFSLFSNPAGIKVHKKVVSVNYIEYKAGIRGGAFVYLHPKNIGIGINYLNYGKMEEFNEHGNKTGEFTPHSMFSTVGYSTNIEKVTIGIALKFIYEKLHKYTSIGIASDIGCITKWQNFIIAASINNIGTQITQFNETKEPIPTFVKIDITSFIFDSTLQIVGSIFPLDRNFSLGCEYRMTKIFDIRFGYYSFGRELATGGGLDIFAGLAFGFGFNTKKIILDYAIIPKVDLGIVHQISLTPVL